MSTDEDALEARRLAREARMRRAAAREAEERAELVGDGPRAGAEPDALEVLKGAQRTLDDTVNIADGTMGELARQREVIESAHDSVRETNAMLDVANYITVGMSSFWGRLRNTVKSAPSLPPPRDSRRAPPATRSATAAGSAAESGAGRTSEDPIAAAFSGPGADTALGGGSTSRRGGTASAGAGGGGRGAGGSSAMTFEEEDDEVDAILTDMQDGLGGLESRAVAMGEELAYQNRVLGEISDEVDVARDKQRKISKRVKKKILS